MKKFIIALAALLGLASCKIDRDLSVVVQEMMTVQNGILINDLGVKYFLATQEGTEDILQQQRVFLTGLAEPADAAGYDYLLRPYEWYSVIVKDCVALSSAEDSDQAWGTAPAQVSHVWFQGGYINVLVTVSYDSDETFDGEVNMVYNDSRSSDSELYFILKNKQTGKTWEDSELSPDKVVFGAQFYSFPYTQYYSAGYKGEQNITIDWRWFDPNPYSEEIPYRTVSSKQGIYSINVQ